jgi:hypothetical protein
MTETEQLTIGVEARCSDGPCGQVLCVVVDPLFRVTHLVVEPKHRQGRGRLVPLDLVGATPDYIRLRCTKDEFEKLNPAEATDYSPGPGGYGVPQPLVHDTVPAGDVAVHGGHHVHATDGDIGKVQGLVIDPASHQVSHFLLQEGHLWGRKRVAIPISAVAGLATGLRLNLSKEQVQDLPSAEIEELSPVKKG